MLPQPKLHKFIGYKFMYPNNEIYSFSFWKDGICTEHDLSKCEYTVKKKNLTDEYKGRYYKKYKYVALINNEDGQRFRYINYYGGNT